MAAKFVVYADKSKKYRFRLQASNGEIIAVGESYETKASCMNGIKSIQKNAPIAAIEDLTEKDETKKAPAKKTAAKAPAEKKTAAKKTTTKKAD